MNRNPKLRKPKKVIVPKLPQLPAKMLEALQVLNTQNIPFEKERVQRIQGREIYRKSLQSLMTRNLVILTHYGPGGQWIITEQGHQYLTQQ